MNTACIIPKKQSIPALDTSCVRIIPELNIAALAQGKDKELKFWYLLQVINRAGANGCGHIRQDIAEKVFTAQFHYPKRTFYRHLSLGMGKLWNIYNNQGSVIEIYGVTRACEYLSTHKISRYNEIPYRHFIESPRKAILWNTGAYKPNDTIRTIHPISRKSLEEKTSIPVRYQQRYDAQAQTYRREVTVKGYDPVTHKRFNQHITVTGKGKKLIQIKRQLGNIYHSDANWSKRGMLRKVSKKLKEQQGSFPLSAGAQTQALIPSKRFYGTFKGYIYAHVRGKAIIEDSYYPMLSNSLIYVQCEVY